VFYAVPQEIIEAVIFEVHDHNTLVHCSLASQTFVHPCHTLAWLFHTIVLSSP
jgi:hypothetical protein